MRNTGNRWWTRGLLQLSLVSLMILLLTVAPVVAQQVTGTLGQADATTTINGKQIPPPPPKFGGVIKETAKDSTPWWPPRIVPPKSAPNVLLIMTDDQGYGVPSTSGVACWLARNDRHERATTERIVALLLYDTAVAAVFLSARSAPGLSGIDLWPAVEVHLGLGVCCLVCLGKELRDSYQRETSLAANRQQLKPLIGGSRIGVWPGVHSPSPASGEGARRDEYYSVPDVERLTEKEADNQLAVRNTEN